MESIQREGQCEDTIKKRIAEVTSSKEEESAAAAKREYFANISPQVKSPLIIISGSCAVLLEELSGGLNEKQREHIKRILESAKTLHAILHGLEGGNGTGNKLSHLS